MIDKREKEEFVEVTSKRLTRSLVHFVEVRDKAVRMQRPPRAATCWNQIERLEMARASDTWGRSRFRA